MITVGYDNNFWISWIICSSKITCHIAVAFGIDIDDPQIMMSDDFLFSTTIRSKLTKIFVQKWRLYVAEMNSEYS